MVPSLRDAAAVSMYPVAILAGGLGTRLGELTGGGKPKALLDIEGKPFIERLLDLLRDNGVDRVVICAGYGGEQLRAMMRHRPGIAFSLDGPKLLGTGGAIRQALPLLGERFFVMYGDAYPLVPLARVQAAFEATKCQALMTVQQVGTSRNPGNVVVGKGRVLRYNKRPQVPLDYFDYGVEAFTAGGFTLPDATTRTPFDLSLVHQRLIDRGQLAALEVAEPVYEVGSFEGLAEFRAYAAGVPA